jgi:1,4-dihydroxy-2-naphthoate octaprenyltransferase
MVLLANNIRDIAYDARQGIKTIGILLGDKRSLQLYGGLLVAVYLYVVAMVVAGMLSPWGLLVLLSLPKAVRLLKSFVEKIPEAADAVTAQLNTVFGLLLMIGLLLDRVVPL